MYYNEFSAMFGLFIFLFVFSLLAGGFLIYKPELLSLYFNRIITRKQVLVGFIIYLIVFLPILIVVASTEGVFLPTKAVSNRSLPGLQAPTPIPTISSVGTYGLKIRRSTMMSAIQQQNSKVSFLPGNTIDGQQTYTATQYKNLMTLVGPENNLTEIISTEPLDADANDNLETILFIAAQARLVDRDIDPWISSTVQEAAANVSGPSPSSFSKSYILHQRQYVFIIQNNTVMLTIKPVAQ